MSLRRRISIPVDTYVDVDIDEIVSELSAGEVAELAAACGVLPSGLGAGDGDDSRLRGIVDQAEAALRRMQNAPRELLDLLYHVHGRAIA
ncbi:hypothetical protein [Pseudoxanthomonas sp. GW2]|uniref:hypothetical protein n=1 Tax=Pseudoxanthomonas sp. GW2 TaxID=1211114 RepID=UPI0002F784B3|nr:hypothetical protein [Pseudoxanthomonas sp. GW2]